MSSMSTHHPVALLRANRGIEIDTYESELDCVLSLINNGSLGIGRNRRTIGFWGSIAHRAAVHRVIEHATEVLKAIDAEQEKERQQQPEVGR